MFVAAEFGLVAVDRTRSTGWPSRAVRPAGVLAAWSATLSFHLSGAQFGITVTIAGPRLHRRARQSADVLESLFDRELPRVA